MSKVAIFINGINTFPGASRNWTGRAVTWCHLHGDDCLRAEKVEYFCGPIGRAFGQKGRALKLARTLSFYNGWDITLAGHSNGVAVILHALQEYASFVPYISALHLFCGAGEASFQRNGLNAALRDWRIGRVTVYVAGHDRALRLAHTIPARLLGYGVMGLGHNLHIWEGVRGRVDVVASKEWATYGHSTCWSDDNFNRTMETCLVEHSS